MRLIDIAFLLTTILPWATCECPDPAQLPVIYPEDHHLFTCAFFYQGPGDPEGEAIQACNTCENEGMGVVVMPEKYEYTTTAGNFIPVGSIIVMPGCQFYGFDETDYQGAVDEITHGFVSPITTFPEEYMTICGEALYGYNSVKCQCQQEFISCEPEDDFYVIEVCDNTDSEVEVECTYSQTIGTTYGESATTSMSVSDSTEAAIQLGFREIFSVDLGTSHTTGYDWSKSDTGTFDYAITTTVSTSIEPGETVTIEQTVGSCSDNFPRANFFRFTSATRSGEKTVSYLQWSDFEGRMVEVDMSVVSYNSGDRNEIRDNIGYVHHL